MKRVMGVLLGAALAAAVIIATAIEPPPSKSELTAPALVYVTDGHGKKFHAQECAGLKRARAAEIESLSREDAEAAGYVACRDCFGR